MKKIEAVIKPFKLDDVKSALADAGISGMTVSEVRGSRSHARGPRDTGYQADFRPRMKVEVVVPDESMHRAVALITTAARTGRDGDGKVFVSSIIEAIHIRTGERGTHVV